MHVYYMQNHILVHWFIYNYLMQNICFMDTFDDLFLHSTGKSKVNKSCLQVWKSLCAPCHYQSECWKLHNFDKCSPYSSNILHDISEPQFLRERYLLRLEILISRSPKWPMSGNQAHGLLLCMKSWSQSLFLTQSNIEISYL